MTGDEQRLESDRGYARATDLFNEQLDEEDVDEWREAAAKEPHPSVEENQ